MSARSRRSRRRSSIIVTFKAPRDLASRLPALATLPTYPSCLALFVARLVYKLGLPPSPPLSYRYIYIARPAPTLQLPSTIPTTPTTPTSHHRSCSSRSSSSFTTLHTALKAFLESYQQDEVLHDARCRRFRLCRCCTIGVQPPSMRSNVHQQHAGPRSHSQLPQRRRRMSLQQSQLRLRYP